ncbi:tetratricopeptide repeat protein [Aquisalimonas sp. APHAB1-3]|uniref:tetratricopeptide repeat protein n=1 Tax=Aquisalimonas sp. APHAB1-3 TaxID=3402080 RepID=UPI003AAD58D2
MFRKLILSQACLFLSVTVGGIGTASAEVGCPAPESRPWSFGPWDYTNPVHREQHLPIMESHHFPREVRNLERSSARSLAQDLRYALNTFPNHHQALRSMTQLVQQEGSLRPDGLQRTLDCWFSRARRFNPDDGMVLMVHGMYYYDIGEYERAAEKMEAGLELEPGNHNIMYNLGLVYVEAGEYEKAREYAVKMYDQGFPLEGLRRKLHAAGHWDG